MFNVISSKNADENIVNIAEFIALDNPYRAITFTQELLESTRSRLSSFPYSGKKTLTSYYIPGVSQLLTNYFRPNKTTLSGNFTNAL